MTEFEHVEGTVINFEKSKNNKTRYITIEGYPKTFSIFIGKDTGDFSPKFEILDSLQAGDLITVYHEDTPLQKNKDPKLDKGVQFIQKGQKLYYERGNKDKYLAYFLFAGGAVLGLLLFLKERKVKKENTGFKH